MNTLREAVEEYLSMRRHLGFKLQDAGRGLLDFVTFMEQRQAPVITQALALAWAQLPMHVQPAHWAKRLSFVRGFARHRSATDPRTEVPSPQLLPFQPKRAKYLYSDEEIRKLLRAARHRSKSGESSLHMRAGPSRGTWCSGPGGPVTEGAVAPAVYARVGEGG